MYAHFANVIHSVCKRVNVILCLEKWLLLQRWFYYELTMLENSIQFDTKFKCTQKNIGVEAILIKCYHSHETPSDWRTKQNKLKTACDKLVSFVFSIRSDISSGYTHMYIRVTINGAYIVRSIQLKESTSTSQSVTISYLYDANTCGAQCQLFRSNQIFCSSDSVDGRQFNEHEKKERERTGRKTGSSRITWTIRKRWGLCQNLKEWNLNSGNET